MDSGRGPGPGQPGTQESGGQEGKIPDAQPQAVIHVLAIKGFLITGALRSWAKKRHFRKSSGPDPASWTPQCDRDSRPQLLR